MFNPLAWPFRWQYLTGTVVCLALIGYAMYTQYYPPYLDPCPLCLFQRLGFLIMGGFFLLGGVHNPGRSGRRVYALLVSIGTLFGLIVAGRHVWLQSLPPDQVPACGPSLEYMLDAFPIGETLRMVFTGSGECAEVHWTFLGLAMPMWSLIFFVLLGVGALWAGFKRR